MTIYTDINAVPRKNYAAIYADPATQFVTRSENGLGRGPEKHYRTMTDAEICEMPIKEIAAPDCHLFLWTTGARLAAGMHLPILKAWGFRSSSLWQVWVKTKDRPEQIMIVDGIDERLCSVGQGYTSRQNAEFIVLGRRGSPKRNDKSVHQITFGQRKRHSEKPHSIYEKIERYCDGPYLELNARVTRPGWDSWGDEVGKFGEVA